MIRVAIVDDHALVRSGLAELLETDPEIEIAGTAADGDAATGLGARESPDVVLMDLSMPGTDGVEATRRIAASGAQARVVALTSFAERFLVQMVSVPPHRGKFTREQVQAQLNRFHYDTAQVTMGGTLASLAKLVPVTQIVYGTDFPYRTAADHSKGVEALFSGDDLKKVDRENALRLLPRLRVG